MLEVKRNPKHPQSNYPASLLISEIEDFREALVQRMMMAETAIDADIIRHQVKCVSEVLGLSDHIIDKLIKGEFNE